MANPTDKTAFGDIPEGLGADAAKLRASGFFDEAFYRAQRPHIPPDIDAAIDYLLHGAMFAPGPLFDAAMYLHHYPDVAASNANPLLHYLNHGREEGRSNVFAPDRPPPKPRLTVPLPPARRDIHELAVVIDALYPQALAAICETLRAIPGQFTLLVAVPDEMTKAIAQNAVTHTRLNARFECRIVPPESQKIANVFSTFAQDVLRHDYVLYLRTRVGQNPNDAARDLIASEPLVDTFIATFETHANVGLIYAAGSPDRVVQSSQEARARSFLSTIGVTPNAAEDTRRFPADGEFWARVDALRPLLESGLSSDDFPEEAAQSEDTFLPALMLTVATIARANFYSLVEYDATTGDFVHWGGRDIGTSFAGKMERLSRLILNAELISFDVFDTLLWRESVSPDSVQRYAGQLLNDLHPETASEFFPRRKAAEHDARAAKGFQGDVGLSEIYGMFKRTAVWTEEVIALARKLEEETDARSLRKGPDIENMLRFSKENGKRLILLSDTYYATDHVKGLLQRDGLADFFDAFYISSDQTARKDRGDLWDKVLACENVSPSRWLHVGDNEHSDIQAASDRKLKHFHLLRPAVQLEQIGLDFRSPETFWATDLAMGPAVNHLAANAGATGAHGAVMGLKEPWEVGFCVFGPIVFAFMQWIVSHPALKSCSSIHFLSREGFLLHRIYEELRAQHPVLGLPQGSYLYASRRAAMSASLAVEFAPHRLVSDVKFNGTMADFLRQRIGLELPHGSGIASSSVKLPGDEARVLDAIRSLEPQITAHARSEFVAYRKYLEQVGLMDSPTPAVVDIGYSATIQAGLQIIADRPMTGFYLGTSPKARQVEEHRGRAFGYLVHDADPGASAEPAMAYALLMEAFLIAPHGQLIAFQSDGETASPVFRAPSHNGRSAAVLTAMHDGAARYCSHLLDVYGVSILHARIGSWLPQLPFKALVDRMIDIPEEAKSALHVEDDFSTVGVWMPLENPNPPWKA